jgi:hypothetical protein
VKIDANLQHVIIHNTLNHTFGRYGSDGFVQVSLCCLRESIRTLRDQCNAMQLKAEYLMQRNKSQDALTFIAKTHLVEFIVHVGVLDTRFSIKTLTKKQNKQKKRWYPEPSLQIANNLEKKITATSGTDPDGVNTTIT